MLCQVDGGLPKKNIELVRSIVQLVNRTTPKGPKPAWAELRSDCAPSSDESLRTACRDNPMDRGEAAFHHHIHTGVRNELLLERFTVGQVPPNDPVALDEGGKRWRRGEMCELEAGRVRE